MMDGTDHPMRLFVDLPECAIESYVVEAFVDSSYFDYDDIVIPKGRVPINLVNQSRTSIRDSIVVNWLIMYNNYICLEVTRYGVSCRVYGSEEGVFAIKTIPDIALGTYWLSIDMQGAIPSVNVEFVLNSGIKFDIIGNADIYCIELFRNTRSGAGYERFWKGITADGTIILPELPYGYEIYPWGEDEIFYQVTAFINPDFTIDDYNLDEAVELEASRKEELYFPDLSLSRARRFPGKALDFQ